MRWRHPHTLRGADPPSPDQLQRFVRTIERYGYWLATPEENAAAGISLF